MKKRFSAMLLSLVMAVSLAVLPAQAAYEPQYTAEAETLYELGLFKGTGINADGTPVFSLENNATRLQALIMLIRLLGQEDEALATTAPNPFTDIDSSRRTIVKRHTILSSCRQSIGSYYTKCHFTNV